METHFMLKANHSKRVTSFTLIVSLICLITSSARPQAGHTLNGVGPVNLSMGGASTANPIDISGALHWNPASITEFSSSGLDIGLTLINLPLNLSSSLNTNVFGANLPPVALAAKSSGTVELTVLPTIAGVYKPADQRWTFGLGIFGIGGFGVDYSESPVPADPSIPTNPITTPPAPNGFGFGEIRSEYRLLQVSLTAAYKLSEHVSVGLAPTINYSTLELFPLAIGPPDESNGDGFPTYSDGPKATAWGYGFQTGIYYTGRNGFHLGASFKSRQLFQDFEFETAGETGIPRRISYNLGYPMIVSLGFGYSGVDGFELALDCRFINFKGTDAFRQSFYTDAGSLKGVGWKNVYFVGAGFQFEISEKVPIRLAYSFNTNPIEEERTFFSVQAPASVQHAIGLGFSYKFNDTFSTSLGFHHGFKNRRKGLWILPGANAISGTSIETEVTTNILLIGASFSR